MHALIRHRGVFTNPTSGLMIDHDSRMPRLASPARRASLRLRVLDDVPMEATIERAAHTLSRPPSLFPRLGARSRLASSRADVPRGPLHRRAPSRGISRSGSGAVAAALVGGGCGAARANCPAVARGLYRRHERRSARGVRREARESSAGGGGKKAFATTIGRQRQTNARGKRGAGRNARAPPRVSFRGRLSRGTLFGRPTWTPPPPPPPARRRRS